MSLTLETYKQDNLYIEYEWDKYEPHYIVFVGRKHSDGLIHTIWTKRYETKEQAKKSFKRQVAKAKKGEIQWTKYHS